MNSTAPQTDTLSRGACYCSRNVCSYFSPRAKHFSSCACQEELLVVVLRSPCSSSSSNNRRRRRRRRRAGSYAYENFVGVFVLCDALMAARVDSVNKVQRMQSCQIALYVSVCANMRACVPAFVSVRAYACMLMGARSECFAARLSCSSPSIIDVGFEFTRRRYAPVLFRP